jgi:hypothetical protein
MASPLQIQVRSRIAAHGQTLNDAVDTLRHAPEHWHTTLLINLAGENLFNCCELIEGVDKSNAARCSWAARSLLEVHYFTRYVMTSPANAQRFREDMICDYQDLLKRLGKNPQNAQSISNGQAVTDQLWSQNTTGVQKSDTYLSARQIADDFGEGAPFGDTHKFLSKFVHPTSLSIQFRNAPQQAARFCSMGHRRNGGADHCPHISTSRNAHRGLQ